MHLPRLIALLAMSTLHAQTFLDMPASLVPNTNEGNTATNVPLMRTDCRYQCAFTANETGSKAFVVKGLTFRHDGTSFHTTPTGPWTVTSFVIKVGTTTVAPAAMTSIYASNLSHPLTTGFNSGFNFTTDTMNVPGPEPWGGNNNELVFPMMAPVPIAIPAGGAFVIDMTLTGNTNNFLANGRLDRHGGTGGQPVGGTATVYGTGCPAGPGLGNAAITVTTVLAGGYGPASSHTVYGSNLGANAPVLTAIGISDTNWSGIPLPFSLPGTSPVCDVLCSFDIMFVQVADAAGAIPFYSDRSMVGVPLDLSLNGATVFHQHLAINAPWAGNPFGITMSNAAKVTFGTFVPASNTDLWNATHVFSSTATVGNNAGPSALVVRVEI